MLSNRQQEVTGLLLAHFLLEIMLFSHTREILYYPKLQSEFQTPI